MISSSANHCVPVSIQDPDGYLDCVSHNGNPVKRGTSKRHREFHLLSDRIYFGEGCIVVRLVTSGWKALEVEETTQDVIRQLFSGLDLTDNQIKITGKTTVWTIVGVRRSNAAKETLISLNAMLHSDQRAIQPHLPAVPRDHIPYRD